jgi:hypothetical protein
MTSGDNQWGFHFSDSRLEKLSLSYPSDSILTFHGITIMLRMLISPV